MVRVTEIGWKACAALTRAGGAARVLAPLSGSIYLVADGEIVWLGRPGSALHCRAMLAPALADGAFGGAASEIAAAPARGGASSADVASVDHPASRDAAVVRGADSRRRVAGGVFDVDATSATIWTPHGLRATTWSAATVIRGSRAVRASLRALGAPDGFAAWLVGEAPPFPLERATARLEALARACDGDDAEAATAAARALLGLGPGLTPAGDDLVGGAFFGRRLLGNAGSADEAAWRRAAADVRALAHGRTHPISAALLGDLLDGQGHAPLHDLAFALAVGAPLDDALAAAARLARVGHSSGWDILAGFIVGVLGTAAVSAA